MQHRNPNATCSSQLSSAWLAIAAFHRALVATQESQLTPRSAVPPGRRFTSCVLLCTGSILAEKEMELGASTPKRSPGASLMEGRILPSAELHRFQEKVRSGLHESFHTLMETRTPHVPGSWGAAGKAQTGSVGLPGFSLSHCCDAAGHFPNHRQSH